jgi:hypothetical protein
MTAATTVFLCGLFLLELAMLVNDGVRWFLTARI